jgi:FkbM family methyltransferase
MTTIHDALALVLGAFEAGDLPQSEGIVGQLLAQLPDHPDVLHLAAGFAERKGNTTQALAWRRKAIGNGAAQRAALFNALGATGEARAMYAEALKADTYNQIACNGLGAMNQLPTPADPDAARFGRPPVHLFGTSLGTYYLPSDAPNDIIILRMKAGQVFEAEIVDALRPFVEVGSAVVDVGSNLGQMALLFSEMVGENGLVYAIEADPYIYSILCKNVAVNNRANVRTINGAAYDHADDTVLYPEQDFKELGSYGSYGVDPTAKEGRPIRTLTIDGLKLDRHISVIKVDIQGCDLIAMRGARETIAKHKPTIIFEFEEEFQKRFGTSFEQYMAFVESIGYRTARIINGINYLIVPR